MVLTSPIEEESFERIKNAERNPHHIDEGFDLGGTVGTPSNNKALAKQLLRERENQAGAPNTGSELNQPTAPTSLAKRINAILWGTKKRKAGTIGSGFIVTSLVGILTLLGYSTGPLEFIHIAQILTHAHFGHISAASDARLGKMMYKALVSKDLGEIDFGDTRLGIFFNNPAQKNAILKDLAAEGIEPDLGTLKTFKGFTIDTTNPNSKYYGMDKTEAVSRAAEDLSVDPKAISNGTSSPYDVWDGKIYVKSSYLNEASTIKSMLGLVDSADKSWLATFIRARTLIRYTAASNFHPFKKLDAKINEKAVDTAVALKEWATERARSLKSGVNPSTADTTKAEEETPGAEGQPPTEVPLPEGTSGPVTSQTVSSTLSGLKAGASAAGIVATAVAIVCMIQTLDNKIGAIMYAQVILPAMRMGTEALSMGSQAQSQQVDTTGQNNGDLLKEEGYIAQNVFVTEDSKTGQVTSSWSDAATMRADVGESGGVDINPALKDAFKGPPTWLDWTKNPAVDTVCSTAGQVISGSVSVVIGVVSGGLVNTVVGVAAGMEVLPKVIDFISGILAGDAIDANASGAEWGNIINYGAGLSANAEAVQFGGTELTNQQVSELNTQQQAADKQQLESESLADRLFNVNDYRSLSGSAIDQLNLTGGPQTVLAKIGSIPTTFISSFFSIPATILMPRAHAATAAYQYPFAEYGFSAEDQNNPLVQDPAANAKAVGELLDHNNTNGEPDYIQNALNCFGVEITKGSDGWDAVPSTNSTSNGTDRTYGVDMYDTATYSKDCNNYSGDSNWLHIRFWIFDTGVMEGYACYLGDATSCSNSGF